MLPYSRTSLRTTENLNLNLWKNANVVIKSSPNTIPDPAAGLTATIVLNVIFGGLWVLGTGWEGGFDSWSYSKNKPFEIVTDEFHKRLEALKPTETGVWKEWSLTQQQARLIQQIVYEQLTLFATYHNMIDQFFNWARENGFTEQKLIRL